MKHLAGVSLLKDLSGTNSLAYYELLAISYINSVITLGLSHKVIILFTAVITRVWSKLECLSLSVLSSLV